MLIIRLRFKIFRIENYFRNLQSSLKTKRDVSHGIDTVQQDQVVDERSFRFQNKPKRIKILIKSITYYKYVEAYQTTVALTARMIEVWT